MNICLQLSADLMEYDDKIDPPLPLSDKKRCFSSKMCGLFHKAFIVSFCSNKTSKLLVKERFYIPL